MLESQNVLRYLSDVGRLGKGMDVPYGYGAPQWELTFDEIRSGRLSMHMTREILLTYSAVHPDVTFGGKGIPVVCCLRMLVSTCDERHWPLLLLEGVLDPNGSLLVSKSLGAWIPLSHISTDELHNAAFAVCDLDTYRAHQVAMASLPDDGTWTTAVDRAVDLFESVSTLDERDLAEHQLRIEADSCMLRMWERNDSAYASVHVLRELARPFVDDDLSWSTSVPLATLLGQGQVEVDEEHDSLPDDALLAQKLLCGIPDHLPILEPSDHAAIVEFARQSRSSLMAMRAPYGTNRLVVCIASAANMLTEHALRGDRAPSMALIGSDRDLGAVLELFSGRPMTGQVALPSRWLPRIAASRATSEATSSERRVLGPLQSVCLVQTADGTRMPAGSASLSQPFGHAQGGSPQLYSDPWYLPKASTYFLDCVSSFLSGRVHSMEEAALRLSERLRMVDQQRCDLIDAYAGVCRASELMHKRDDLVARIGRLRRGHAICKARLEFWSRIDEENPPRKALFDKSDPDQSSLIAHHAQRGEEIALGCKTVHDVCVAYGEEIGKLEEAIERLRAASANLNRRIHAASPAGEECSAIIERLCGLCNLDADQSALLEASMDGRAHDVTLSHMDQVLDQTIRPAEFWLAVHVYEARWLELCQRRDSLVQRMEDLRVELLGMWANFCPLLLVSTDTAVEALASFELPDERVDRTRVDLAVVLDADTITLTEGFALAGLSRRMLVVGSQGTLGTRPLRSMTFDELQARALLGDQTWADLRGAGLSCSQNRSLLDVALERVDGASSALAVVSDSCAELLDLRSQLVPEEPVRTPHADAGSDAMPQHLSAGVAPALSYVLVPDSAWEQRGSSRQNRSEALAVRRWLKNHLAQIAQRHVRHRGKAVLVLAPYEAQANLLRRVIGEDEELDASLVSVRCLKQVRGGTWPVVVVSTTCGPDGLAGTVGLGRILNTMAATATDNVILFCGGAWLRTYDEVASGVIQHATRVGRLFSMPRRRPARSDGEAVMQTRYDLRAKPLSLGSLLKDLEARGEILGEPSVSDMEHALARVGLIERVRTEAGKAGWRPTAAGREVGILSTRDREGSPICVYSSASEAVIASVVESLGEDIDD